MIHPGSLNLRIGRASDLNPLTILHAIARRCLNTKYMYRDGFLPPRIDLVIFTLVYYFYDVFLVLYQLTKFFRYYIEITGINITMMKHILLIFFYRVNLKNLKMLVYQFRTLYNLAYNLMDVDVMQLHLNKLLHLIDEQLQKLSGIAVVTG